mmetsp:Transcript_2511/g.9477  ORF Transcript_2511/g.9477 Transcript_2511/m.9477 type:complete len:111 (+) Transcript_2511:454-786(+)
MLCFEFGGVQTKTADASATRRRWGCSGFGATTRKLISPLPLSHKSHSSVLDDHVSQLVPIRSHLFTCNNLDGILDAPGMQFVQCCSPSSHTTHNYLMKNHLHHNISSTPM